MEKEKTEEKDKKLVKCSECNSTAYIIDANTHEIVCAVCGKKLY
jgi:ribosomal protein S27E